MQAEVARISFLLFCAGAVAGIFQLFYPFGPGGKREVEFGEGYEMVAIALNLANDGAFANPYRVMNTGPTAVEPPLYPFLLAAPTRIFKDPDLIVMAATTGVITANALTAAWLPRLSLLFFGEMAPGILAGMLWLAAARLLPSWDTSYTVAGLVFFCLFSGRSIDRGERTTARGVQSGVIAGVVTLLNSAALLVIVPWIADLLLRRAAPFRRTARYGCALLATLGVIVLAWAVRNYRVVGASALRTGFGMTFYASNNDCAESSQRDELKSGCFQAHHPNDSFRDASMIRALGEAEYDRRRTVDARNWIAAHPGRFRQLTLQRVRDFWFPPPGERAYMDYLIWLATVLSVPGLILMARRREPMTRFVAATLLLYPIMYYVVITSVRYRYPVLSLSLLPAGYLLVHVVRLLKPSDSGSPA